MLEIDPKLAIPVLRELGAEGSGDAWVLSARYVLIQYLESHGGGTP